MLSINCNVQSSISISIQCGDKVSGSTVGLPDVTGDGGAGDQVHKFCPREDGTALVDTCESDYDTKLYVNGPGVDLNCDDSSCGMACGFGRQESAMFDFKAGECYDVIVGGYANSEGNYVLSISCPQRNASTGTTATTTTTTTRELISIECGSSVSGSTAVFRQPFSFCPNATGRVYATTCGSRSFTEVSSTAAELNTDCGADCNAGCIEFNFRPEWGIDRGGGWFALVTIICTEPVLCLVPCALCLCLWPFSARWKPESSFKSSLSF